MLGQLLLPLLLLLLLASRPPLTSGFLLAAAAAMASSSSSGMGLGDIGGSQGEPAAQPTTSAPAASCSSSKPRWVQDLEAALETNKADVHSRFLQLATVRRHEDGSHRPHVRWAVFRGFVDDDGPVNAIAIAIVTDARSDKVRDLRANPHAEVGWYFVQSREQFRVKGTVRVVTDKEEGGGDEASSSFSLAAARRRAWQGMSDAARLQFAWPAPGAPQPPEGVDPAVFLSPSPPPPKGDEPPPETFVLLVVEPSRVDHLQLRPSPQVRRIHTKGDGDGEWATVAVNP